MGGTKKRDEEKEEEKEEIKRGMEDHYIGKGRGKEGSGRKED